MMLDIHSSGVVSECQIENLDSPNVDQTLTKVPRALIPVLCLRPIRIPKIRPNKIESIESIQISI